MSSITVGQIMNQAARELGVPAPMVTSAFATATLVDLAQALDELADTALPGDADADLPPEGIGPWVRSFSVEFIETDRPAAWPPRPTGRGRYSPRPGHPLKKASATRSGWPNSATASLLLPAAGVRCRTRRPHAAPRPGRRCRTPGPCRFLAVQDRRGAAGLAKTLHLEAPAVPVTVITLPLAAPIPAARAAELADAIAADVAATAGFSEVQYDAAGIRRVPLLRPVTDLADHGAELPLGPGDVLLVSGGGKGITAECALTLARTPARLSPSSGDPIPRRTRNSPPTWAGWTRPASRYCLRQGRRNRC